MDFSAGDWCGPCSHLKPTIRKVSAQLKGKLKVGIVACDEHKALCSKYNVNSYPHLGFFSAGLNKRSVLGTMTHARTSTPRTNTRICLWLVFAYHVTRKGSNVLGVSICRGV